jgi:hypothetical protein
MLAVASSSKEMVPIDNLAVSSDCLALLRGSRDQRYSNTQSWRRISLVWRGSQSRQHEILSHEALFETLRLKWYEERGATSSITQMMLCPSYQRIIGMGERAAPLILRALESEGGNPDHWGWALHAITGEDPVPFSAAGDTVRIAQAWLEWGGRR